MKKLFLCLSVTLLAVFANAQPPAGDAKPGEWYGEKTMPDGAVAIADVAAKLAGGTESMDTKFR